MSWCEMTFVFIHSVKIFQLT